MTGLLMLRETRYIYERLEILSSNVLSDEALQLSTDFPRAAFLDTCVSVHKANLRCVY